MLTHQSGVGKFSMIGKQSKLHSVVSVVSKLWFLTSLHGPVVAWSVNDMLGMITAAVKYLRNACLFMFQEEINMCEKYSVQSNVYIVSE